jgi:hypothetical protein
VLKYYRTEREAKNASAHLGLYLVLVSNTEDTSIFPGASFARAGFANAWDEHETAVPYSPVAKHAMPDDQKASNSGSHLQKISGQNTNSMQNSTASSAGQEDPPLSKAQRKSRNRRLAQQSAVPPPSLPEGPPSGPDTSNEGVKQKRKRESLPTPANNPNPYPGHLQPSKETHPWLSKFAAAATEKRWNVSSKALKWQTRHCVNQRERVAGSVFPYYFFSSLLLCSTSSLHCCDSI